MLITGKKVVITNHCLERFAERKREMRKKEFMDYEKNPRKYLINLLQISNVKSKSKVGNIITLFTKQNYKIIIIDKKTEWIVKTICIFSKERYQRTLRKTRGM